MKNISTYLLFLFLMFPALTTFAQDKDKVDIFGYYTIVKPSKAFADISLIHLAGDQSLYQKPPFYGLIRLKKKGAKDYALLKPIQTGKNLKFTTEEVGGVYYKFDGDFTKLGDFPTLNPSGEVILTGRLTKYKGKTKIAESKVRLSYEAGD